MVNKMNNDNLKRVLNKISGADRASVQQKTPPTHPNYEINDDMDFQITPSGTTRQERTRKYCNCIHDLLDQATDLVTSRDGWDAHLKWITTYCFRHLGLSRGSDVSGIDTVATAALNCPNFWASANYAECWIHCSNLGYQSGTQKMMDCIGKCVTLAPKPPLINPPAANIFDPLGAFPRVAWEVVRRTL